jgi:hypothetical protein
MKEWQKVLNAMYEHGLVWSVDADIDESHPAVKETDLSEERAKEALSFLSEAGLIGRIQAGAKADYPREMTVGISEEARRRGTHIGLTTEGFNVAHERELRNQQETHNRILAAFTVLVGISALVQAVSVVATQTGPMQWILGFISVTGALAFAYVLKGKAEIFTG